MKPEKPPPKRSRDLPNQEEKGEDEKQDQPAEQANNEPTAVEPPSGLSGMGEAPGRGL